MYDGLSSLWYQAHSRLIRFQMVYLTKFGLKVCELRKRLAKSIVMKPAHLIL